MPFHSWCDFVCMIPASIVRRGYLCRRALLALDAFLYRISKRTHVKSVIVATRALATSFQATAALYSRAAYRQRLQAPCGGRVEPTCATVVREPKYAPTECLPLPRHR